MKKKFGDLTLREIVEIENKHCPVSSCKECREKHSADYAVCQLDIDYDIDKLDLDQEVEVERNHKDIDNLNPSEALKIVNSHLEVLEKEKYNTTLLKQDFTTIKQYILKAQEQEKVLKIIMKKDADIQRLMKCINVATYNNGLPKNRQLTEEEFDTLKRCFQ